MIRLRYPHLGFLPEFPPLQDRISCESLVGSAALVEICSFQVIFVHLYILTVSRDPVVNGQNFYLIHLGLIPGGTI